MKILLVALSALLLFPAVTWAGSEELDSVIANARQRVEAADFRATGRLVQVSANGDRKNYKFSMKVHWFPDGLLLLCEITDPVQSRLQLRLQMDPHGRIAIKVLHPGSREAIVLPFEKWNDGLLGTYFSFEDLVEAQLFWRNQQLLELKKYGARDCFVLQSEPGPSDKTHDSSVTSYLDRQIFYPVYVVKTLRGTGETKEFTSFGLRQSDGVWSASQIEVKISGKEGSSLLIVDRGSVKANLVRKDFDLTYSPRHKEP